jgi:hypothetical protein
VRMIEADGWNAESCAGVNDFPRHLVGSPDSMRSGHSLSSTRSMASRRNNTR